VTTATEIIAFLLARRPAPIVEKSTGLPHGWGIWLRNAPQRQGRLSRASVDALIAQLAVRPVAPAPVAAPMGRWRALRSLLWQHWDPPPREERGTRWAGGLGSLLLHLGLFLALILVSLIPVPQPQDQADGTRVQLTLIGRGTQGEGGGAGPQTPDAGAQAAAAAQASGSPTAPRPAGAKAAAEPAAEAAAAPAEPAPPAASAPASAPEVAVQPAPPSPPQPPSAPQPEPPQPAPAEQPLQVTEASQPTRDFVLPPVTPPQLQLQAPQVQLPQISARVREIETVQDQRPVAVQQPAPRPVDVPSPRAAETQVRQREIPMPAEVPIAQAPALQPVRPAAAPSEVQLRAPQPTQARVREIPMPPAPASAPAPQTTSAAAPDPTAAPGSSAASAADTAATTSSSASSASPAEAAQAGQGQAAQSSSSTATTGAPPSPMPGGQTAGSVADAPGAGARPSDSWGTPGPKTADDWGAANKAAPGTEAGAGQGLKGLFNADGSAKLPDGLAGGSTVRPGVPGSRQQARLDADRAGTWLERPAFGYEPTMFDKYWIPGGSLLQDWVRAGVREMEIPIPGTGKRIRCVVSVLQAGGACGLFDPDKNDQPASARPPPDIPVKRNPIPEGS
jgi:hypothetical protein